MNLAIPLIEGSEKRQTKPFKNTNPPPSPPAPLPIKKSKCSDCGKENEPRMEICRVCELIDNDTSKKLCQFCLICDAFICTDDATNFIRRGKAFFKNHR